jgi:hypothetical protein
VIENEEMDFKGNHVDEDGEYDQTGDACAPVPELGSLLVSSEYGKLESRELDELQAYGGHRTYSIGPRLCRDQPEP